MQALFAMFSALPGRMAGGLVAIVAVGAPRAAEPASPAPPPPAARETNAPAAAKPAAAKISAVDDLLAYTASVRTGFPMLPGIYDGSIARLTASVLQNAHYSRHPFNREMSRRFYGLYLDHLDPQHFHFTQEDLAEFAHYRDRLNVLTLKEGNTTPAFEIFGRFLERLHQRTLLVARLLKTNHFTFDGNDRYLTSRKDEPWPKNLAEARHLWTQHLRYEYLSEKLHDTPPEEIVEKLAKRYKRTLRLLAEFDSDDVIQVYLGALCNAYDPHTDYMGKARLENFAISMKLSLFGIGALLRYDDGYCTIESLIPEGPAEKSKKIHPQDRIVAVQQEGEEPVDIVGMKLQKVVEMIRGPKGTPVTLTIIPARDDSARIQVTLIRDEIKLKDQQARAEIIDLPDAAGHTNRLGLIDLPSFYATMQIGDEKEQAEPRSTTKDVARLIRKLEKEGVKGIVLDLRRNGGGSLEEAIRLTGLFIREGPIVQVRDTAGEIDVESDPDPTVLYDGPMIVLTSRFSASASEILAAALQDYGRALIVGDKCTHGKGTVQTIFELARSRRFPSAVNPGAVKITIRKFYRANGESTQLRGVVPDLILPSVNNLLDVGEASQKYALPWDTIPSADFTPLNRIAPIREELVRRSEARQRRDKDFAYVREDMAEYERREADKTVSLNEKIRRRERAEDEARREARKKERAARKPLNEVRYEITLDTVDQPGLPDPISEDIAATDTRLPETTAAETAPADSPAAAPSGKNNKTAPDSGASDDTENEPVVDVGLKEAKRILVDLIHLLAPGNKQTASPVAAAAH